MSRNKEREQQEAREWEAGMYFLWKLFTDPAMIRGLQNDLEDMADMQADMIRALQGKPPKWRGKRESAIATMQEFSERKGPR